MQIPAPAAMDDAVAVSCDLSEDGYIRLSPERFMATELQHLMSGLETGDGRLDSAAIAAEIRGYTEWVSSTIPAITIGWDWRLIARDGHPDCIRTTEPFSNLMLLDPLIRDLGPVKTSKWLGRMIDRRPWSQTVLAAITTRYS